MFVYEGIGGVVLFLTMSVLAIYFYGRSCRDVGYEEGRADLLTALAAEQAENRARGGRHARSEPRASAPAPAPAAETSERLRARVSWQQAVDIYNDRRAAKGQPPVDGRGRPAVTPAEIETILLAPEAAPALNGAADTATIPKVQLDMASTGEMRAITSAWIADNCPGAEEVPA